MTPQTIDLPALSFRAVVAGIDAEKRTADLIFSTGAPVMRTDFYSGKQYREVLSMDPSHVKLDRLNSAGVLLDTHSAWSIADVLGAVEPGTARVAQGKGLVTVRFSKRDAVTDVWNDVRDGIIRSVSVGARVFKFQEDSPKDGGVMTRTAIDWEPFEVSLVGMPADVGAKVRRGEVSDMNTCVILTRDALGMTDADRNRRFRLAAARG